MRCDMNELKSVKIPAYIALVLSVFALIPFVGIVFTILSYAVMFFAVKGVNSRSQSPTLLRNFVIFVLLMVVVAVLELLGSASSAASVFGAMSGDAGLATSGIIVKVLTYAAIIAGIVFGYFYYREMSRLSDVSLFFIAYVFVLLDKALSALWLGWIAWVFVLVAFILELIAWIKLDHINKASVEMMK